MKKIAMPSVLNLDARLPAAPELPPGKLSRDQVVALVTARLERGLIDSANARAMIALYDANEAAKVST